MRVQVLGIAAVSLVVLWVAGASLTGNLAQKPAIPEPSPARSQLVLFVDGLFPGGQPCASCIETVLGSVQQSPGVLAASFTFQSHVVLTYDPERTNASAILANPVFSSFPAAIVEESPIGG